MTEEQNACLLCATTMAKHSPTSISRTSRAASHRSTANPHSVPTPSRWHPPPATAHADSAGEEYVSVPEVSKVVEVMKVMEADEVVVWRHHGMVASPSGGHVWTTHTTSAVHTAHAMHTAHHRVGRHHRRGKHRHYDSASGRYFAEHDNPPKLMLARFARPRTRQRHKRTKKRV